MAIPSLTTESPSSPNDETTVTEFWVGRESILEENVSSISPSIVQLIHQGLASPETGFEFSGNNNPTEKAILSWAIMGLKMDAEKMKKSCAVLPFKPLDSQKHGIKIGRNNDDSVHVHWKGAAEMILPMCSRYYDGHGAAKGIDDGERTKFEQIIRGMAAGSLRCIAFAHRQVPEEEYDDLSETEKLNENDLTLLGLVGIKELTEKPAVVG